MSEGRPKVAGEYGQSSVAAVEFLRSPAPMHLLIQLGLVMPK